MIGARAGKKDPQNNLSDQARTKTRVFIDQSFVFAVFGFAAEQCLDLRGSSGRGGGGRGAR